MKLVILDRDGVINEDSASFIKAPAEWRAIPGSLQAIAKLAQAGYRIAIATNQSGLQRDLFGLDALHQIHAKMHLLVTQAGGHIDAIFFCPYRDQHHPCRKPNPGMYEDLANRLQVDLRQVPVVGDSLRDLVPAIELDARPILVRTGKGQRTLEQHGDALDGVEIFDDLLAVADHLLAPPPVVDPSHEP